MMIVNASGYRQPLIALLQAEKLPAGDLPENLDDFIAITDGDELVGGAGRERYGNYGLLRSVVIAAGHRGRGIAGELINAIESLAAKDGITTLFLLTETAQDYFNKKGYHITSRDDVPDAVRQSSEFSHVCPVSAIVMRKDLSVTI